MLELLLASSLGLILFGVGMTLLMGDARSAAMAAALQGRRWQRRTLALIQADLHGPPVGRSIRNRPPAGPVPWLDVIPAWRSSPRRFPTSGVCHWRAPSPIWRGPVLVRCGPAYGLEGLPRGCLPEPSRADGVDRFGVIPHPDLPVLQLELEQRRGDQLIRSLGVG